MSERKGYHFPHSDADPDSPTPNSTLKHIELIIEQRSHASTLKDWVSQANTVELLEKIMQRQSQEAYQYLIESRLSIQLKELIKQKDLGPLMARLTKGVNDPYEGFILAHAAFTQEQFELTEDTLDELTNSGFYHPQVFILKTQLYFKQKRYELCEQNFILGLYVTGCKNITIVQNYAKLLLLLNDDLSARLLTDIAVECKPSSLPLYYLMADLAQRTYQNELELIYSNMRMRLKHQVLAHLRITNYAERDYWKLFRTNRNYINTLLKEMPGNTLAIIGAGNCNNFELKEIARTYDDIALIDVDQQALINALEYQEMNDAENIHLYPTIDVSGLMQTLSEWQEPPSDKAIIETAIESSERSTLQWPGRYDCVIVDDVFSNIFDYMCLKISNDKGACNTYFKRVLLASYRKLFEVVRPNGILVIITKQTSIPIENTRNPQAALQACLEQLACEQDPHHPLSVQYQRALLQTASFKALPHETIFTSTWPWFYPGKFIVNRAMIIKMPPHTEDPTR